MSVSEGAEEAFASVTDFDRAYARFDWALNENSAAVSGTLGFSAAAGTDSAQMTAQLSGGEMMLTVGEFFEDAVVADEDAVVADEDGRFCRIHYNALTSVAGPGQKDYTVTAKSPEAEVLSVFSLLSFSRVQKEYFQLKEGTDDVLILSEAGEEWYVYCESLEITCGEGDVFTVNAAVDGSSAVMYVTSVSLTVSEVGEERAAVVFPAEMTAAHEEFHASQEQ